MTPAGEVAAKRFASRVDIWAWFTRVMCVAMVLAGVPLAILYAWTRTSEPVLLASFVSMSVFGVLGSWVHLSTRYEITQRDLIARSGPWRWRVPLAAIESVTPTRELRSAPALSLDRLQVLHRESAYGLLVSPKDREGFLQALLHACPHLRRQGDGLRRT